MSFTQTTIKIPSSTDGWNLDVWQYLPPRHSAPHPVIIMAHGLSSNKLMGLSEYAETFVAQGYACLVFDYRRWGTSDGTPRHVVVVKEQLEDYRTLIKYARNQEHFDGQRVILWGTSFAGGHVTTLAAEPSLTVQAVIAQCPHFGFTPTPSLSTGFLATTFLAVYDYAKQSLGFQPTYIPAAAPPGCVGVMTTPDSMDGIRALVKDESSSPNELSASSLLEVAGYKPYKIASKIAFPLLLIAPEDDTLCILEGATRVSKASEKVHLVRLPECGHFEVYPGQKEYNTSLQAQLEFLKEHVPL
ncbi:alpha/beta-hydrolase [Pluteus cervinus]|uniref:Alpha/beta-hydrolase n=1 Tax=Pluteus cervinus TaxID=181527 RepID=A0ACD3B5B5_9AGAR|nr:alpha/beta-hydrolase [Pluteus cervinus]